MKIKRFSKIDIDEKLYSVLMSEEELALFSEVQKEFNSKAQKARRTKWEIKNATAKLTRPGTEEYFRDTVEEVKEKAKEAGISLSEKDAVNSAKKRISRREGGEFKMAMKTGKWRTMDALHSTNDNIKRNGVNPIGLDLDELNFKRNIKRSTPSTDLFKKEAAEDKAKYSKVNSNRVAKKATEIVKSKSKAINNTKALNLLPDIKKAVKDTIKTTTQESTQKMALAPVKNQVNKNRSGILKKGMQWASRHKVGLGVATGTAALAGGGAYILKKRKKDNQQDKDNK